MVRLCTTRSGQRRVDGDCQRATDVIRVIFLCHGASRVGQGVDRPLTRVSEPIRQDTDDGRCAGGQLPQEAFPLAVTFAVRRGIVEENPQVSEVRVRVPLVTDGHRDGDGEGSCPGAAGDVH